MSPPDEPEEKTAPRVGSHAAAPGATWADEADFTQLLRRRWRLIIAAGVLLVILAAGVIVLLFTPPVRASLTIAVQPFGVSDDDEASDRVAAALPRAVADELRSAGMTVVAAPPPDLTDSEKLRAADKAPVDILLDGVVTREQGKVRVAFSISHGLRSFTLWRSELTGDPADMQALARRVAAAVQERLAWAPAARILRSGRANAAEEAERYVRIAESGNRLERWEAAKAFAADAHDLAYARISAAIETYNALPALGVVRRPEALAYARAEADAALKLQPSEGAGFLARMFLIPPDRWAERLALLKQGEAADPQNPLLATQIARLNLAAGHLDEALAAAQRAAMADKLSIQRIALFAQSQLALGDLPAMEETLAKIDSLSPGSVDVAMARFRVAAFSGSPGDAADWLLKAYALPRGEPPPDFAILSAMIAAKQSGRAEDADAIVAMCGALAAGDMDDAGACMLAGGMLSRPDAFFLGADIFYPRTHNSPAGQDAWLARPCCEWEAARMFTPWMAKVRADPRIIPVFERIGLLDYWRTSKRWPDFCEHEPGPVCSQMKAMP